MRMQCKTDLGRSRKQKVSRLSMLDVEVLRHPVLNKKRFYAFSEQGRVIIWSMRLQVVDD